MLFAKNPAATANDTGFSSPQELTIADGRVPDSSQGHLRHAGRSTPSDELGGRLRYSAAITSRARVSPGVSRRGGGRGAFWAELSALIRRSRAFGQPRTRRTRAPCARTFDRCTDGGNWTCAALGATWRRGLASETAVPTPRFRCCCVCLYHRSRERVSPIRTPPPAHGSRHRYSEPEVKTTDRLNRHGRHRERTHRAQRPRTWRTSDLQR